MALFGDDSLKCDFIYLSGINSLQNRAFVRIKQDDTLERLEIKVKGSKEEPFILNYTQITGCDVIRNLKIEKNGNTVISSAVLGGLILGPLGAVIGGMSGVGNNGTTILKCFVINYCPIVNPEEINAILMQISPGSVNWAKFVDCLKIKTNTNKILSQNPRQL